MAVINVRIPQLGEGLQEARLVGVLKQPGESIKRDEPIYQMETDKAVMDVESPYDGVLIEWLAKPDDILAIGAEVARMEVEGDVQEMSVHGAAKPPQASSGPEDGPSAFGSRNANIPPKTRAYAKEKGVSEEQLAGLAASGAKLLPTDIDAYLAISAKPANDAYSETPVDPKQRLLASRLVRGSQVVVPGTMSVTMSWTGIEHLRARYKSAADDFKPSAFTMFAFAVAHGLREFPIFRSTLVADDTLRTYRHVQLGIAVTLPEDQLVLAVVPDADTLDWRQFAETARERIELARTGKDQANEAVTLSLTNMQSYGLRDAVPVVVPPAVATLFLGAAYNGLVPDSMELQIQRTANMALTFDHRLVNGARAAEFLNAVKAKVEAISTLIDGGIG
jgi:pyruvate dehydrogenase E2 component (dihydrolipoamide acetyltransferase)